MRVVEIGLIWIAYACSSVCVWYNRINRIYTVIMLVCIIVKLSKLLCIHILWTQIHPFIWHNAVTPSTRIGSNFNAKILNSFSRIISLLWEYEVEHKNIFILHISMRCIRSNYERREIQTCGMKWKNSGCIARSIHSVSHRKWADPFSMLII